MKDSTLLIIISALLLVVAFLPALPGLVSTLAALAALAVGLLAIVMMRREART